MNIQDLTNLALQHKWIAVSALVIGAFVRLLKSDGPIPINVPARWRPVLALVLGLASAALAQVANGTPWRRALTEGLLAGVIAIVGHDVLVEGVRGGKEIPMGKAAPTPKPEATTPS